MIEILLRDIPKFLFAPVAVTAFIGAVSVIFLNWKQRKSLYCFIALSIIFMISWRCGCRIITSRYSSILLYPAAIAAAYCCLQAGSLLKKFFRIPDKFVSVVQWILISLLLAGCIAKTIRYNPYHDHIVRAAEIIAADAKQYKNVEIFCTTDEVVRMKYYSGLPVQAISVGRKADLLDDVFKLFAQNCDAGYIVRFEPSSQAPLADLRRIPPWLKKNIELIGEFYHNKKKKRYTRVYRCRISDIHKEFKLSLKYSPAANEGNLTSAYRFTFGKSLPDNSKFCTDMKRYFKQKIPVSQVPVLKDFPSGWSLYGTPGYLPGSNSELGIVVTKGGRRTFRLKCDSRITAYTSHRFHVKRYKIKMKAYGRKASVFGMGFHAYDSGRVHVGYYSLPRVRLEEDCFFEYSVIVPEVFFYNNAFECSAVIDMLCGELRVLAVELFEERIEDKY